MPGDVVPVVENPPARDRAEIAAHVAKAIISLVPGFGGTAAKVVDMLVGPRVERRRTEWEASVGDALREISERLGTVDVRALQENDQFVTAVLITFPLAMKTHQEEAPGAGTRDPSGQYGVS